MSKNKPKQEQILQASHSIDEAEEKGELKKDIEEFEDNRNKNLDSVDASLTTYVGIIAGVLTAISMMPQVFKTIKTKKAEHVSLRMLILLLCGVASWIVYGCLKDDLPIICTNIFSFVVNTFMLILRSKYGNSNLKND